jgi:hypothetical protein
MGMGVPEISKNATIQDPGIGRELGVPSLSALAVASLVVKGASCEKKMHQNVETIHTHY